MILVVDDDTSVTTSLSLLLKQAGYQTATAASPAEALAWLERGGCELVLQDMNFSRQTSGEEGLELLQEIKQRWASMPVILMTAWGSIELAVQGIKAGAADFVTKREGKRIWFTIDTEMPALLIGNKGKTLDALQMLTNIYVSRITDRDLRVVLEVHEYRERRVGQIKKMVYQAITNIRNGEESVLLEPMNAFERQLVHQYINDSRGLTTKSEGEKEHRCVRIMRARRKEKERI